MTGAKTARGRVTANSSSAPKRALLATLNGLLPSMTATERLIAEHVLADPERVIGSTIADFARSCGASVGSIIAFCRRVELKGYADFKIALARDLAETGFPAGGKAKDATLLEDVIHFHQQCLQDVLKINGIDQFDKAVQAIHAARRIEFFAIGISQPIAVSAASKLMLLGLPTGAQPDAHMQLIAATHLRRGDIAFGISLSGSTRETISCLDVARGQGATTICITNAMESPITKFSDHCLFGTPSEIGYFQAPLASRVTQLALVDALFVALARKNKKTVSAKLQKSAEALHAYRS